jgi:hypothetical protein
LYYKAAEQEQINVTKRQIIKDQLRTIPTEKSGKWKQHFGVSSQPQRVNAGGTI